jgi:transposase InsO family protein
MRSTELPLPEAWPTAIHSAMRYVAALAHYTIIQTRSWCANSQYARVRLAGKAERAECALATEREVNRIIVQRMARLPANRRPHFTPIERLQVLEVRAANGWTLAETGRRFGVMPATISSWEKELENPGTLLKMSQPVNTYDELTKAVVRRLKVLCPVLGKKKIAQFLARAGLHLGVSTVGRIVRSKPTGQSPVVTSSESSDRIVTAPRPGHTWHCDLTLVPTSRFYVPWLPHALPQSWPFCWWVVFAMDHCSRACIGFAIFSGQPRAQDVHEFLDGVIAKHGKPKYIITDSGKQFDCHAFRTWCTSHVIEPRFGAIGQHGSIAVIERFIKSFKGECMRRILVPYGLDDARHEISLYVEWYNIHRPHETLGGATPHEVFHGLTPANHQPRFEPREAWPGDSSCAAPPVDVDSYPAVLQLDVAFLEGRRHLPIVQLQAA